MDRIVIRKFSEADVGEVRNLLYELDCFHSSQFPDHYRSPAEIDAMRVEKGFFRCCHSGELTVYIAWDQNRAVGLVTGIVKLRESLVYRTKTVGTVNELVVLPEYRGSTLASRLMETIEQYFVDNGAEEFSLSVAGFNTRARNFYIKLGYSTESRMMLKQSVNAQESRQDEYT